MCPVLPKTWGVSEIVSIYHTAIEDRGEASYNLTQQGKTHNPHKLLDWIPRPRGIAAHRQLQLRWFVVGGRHGYFPILLFES